MHRRFRVAKKCSFKVIRCVTKRTQNVWPKDHKRSPELLAEFSKIGEAATVIEL